MVLFQKNPDLLLIIALSDLSACRVGNFNCCHFWVFHPRSHMAINTDQIVLVACYLLNKSLSLENILDTVHEAERGYEVATVEFTQ